MSALRFAATPLLATLFLAAACGDSGSTDKPTDTADDPSVASNQFAGSSKSDAGGSKSQPKADGSVGTGSATPTDAGVPARSDATVTRASDAAVALGDDAGSDGGGDGPSTSGPSCLDGITDYENAGPFKFEAKTSGSVKLWVPAVPAGCKVPVIHLANGTTANCGNYQEALERFASHGFLTTCYEDPNTGAGTMGITAFETALSMYPDLADNKFGSTGHSQGGQAAIVTVQLAEAKYGNKNIYAGLAMEPASGYGTQPAGGTWQSIYAKIKSPIFMFSGDSSTGFANSTLLGVGTGDGLVAITWVQEGFDALSKSVEAYHWTAIGATHIPTPVGPEQQVSIPWFRWKLLGDTKACEFFKKMPDGTKWKSQKEQNAQACP